MVVLNRLAQFLNLIFIYDDKYKDKAYILTRQTFKYYIFNFSYERNNINLRLIGVPINKHSVLIIKLINTKLNAQ